MSQEPSTAAAAALRIISTGVPGLDDVVGGGLRPCRMYLALGDPGVGKTTLALQFVLEGVRHGERCLYVALSETRDELLDIARSHGWALDGLDIIELHPVEGSLGVSNVQTMFHPIEVDLDAFTAPLRERIAQARPARAVIDSLSELRTLAQEPRRFQQQIVALKAQFASLGCTLLVIDDRPGEQEGSVPQTFAHGVVTLEAVVREYGVPRRRMRVPKMRGARVREGYHDFRIRTGGLIVYPRLVASEHEAAFTPARISSGVPALDAMLGGGLSRGTSALLMGPAGAGKSVVVSQYAFAAAQRGERTELFVFDEARETFLTRAACAGMDLRPHIASGLVRVRQVDPAEMTPGELAHVVRRAVDQEGARLVVIDSLNGYLSSVPEEQFLTLHLHEMLDYLGQRGAVTLLTLAQHGLLGLTAQNDVDVSYLADTVILLRFFEAVGEMRKAISVPKMRSGQHELSLREYRISARGIYIGDPVRDFQGVLSGTPTYVGQRESLLGGEPHAH